MGATAQNRVVAHFLDQVKECKTCTTWQEAKDLLKTWDDEARPHTGNVTSPRAGCTVNGGFGSTAHVRVEAHFLDQVKECKACSTWPEGKDLLKTCGM